MSAKTDAGTPATVTGLYQYIVAAAAIFFSGSPVNDEITSKGATVPSVMAELMKCGLDLTGIDASTFQNVIAGLLKEQNAISTLSAYFSTLTDPDYIGPGHGEAQFNNLFGPAKALEQAINLNLSVTAAVQASRDKAKK